MTDDEQTVTSPSPTTEVTESGASSRVAMMAAIGAGLLALAFGALWMSARGDLDEARSDLRAYESEAQAVAEQEAALPDLEDEVRSHNLSPVADESDSEYASLTLEGRALTDLADELGELLGDLGFSGGIMGRIENTRALDGTLEADGDHVRASWTYHPDDGLSLVLEVVD